VEETGLKQPNVSNHLQRLRTRNIVLPSRNGRQIFYSLASEEIDAILQALVSVRTIEREPSCFEDLVTEYVRFAIQGDESGALDVLDQAFRSYSALIDIYEGLLAPAMRMVGEQYELDLITEADEHMATEITLRCMAKTMHVTGPAKRHGKRCVIGCPPNEWHSIGARMASDVLRLTGWRTLFIGANVPVRSFLTAVFQHRPDLVLVSCSTQESLEPSARLVRELCGLRRSQEFFQIGAGGIITEDGVRSLRSAGADFFAGNLRRFAHEIVPMLERGDQLPGSLAWPGLVEREQDMVDSR
jgi:methanogenic corrinoid protein MtbC1